jgi:hypothetical protein
MVEVTFCPNCGAPKSKPTDKFCGQCGAAYDEILQPQPIRTGCADDKSKITKQIPRKHIIYIVIVLVAIVVFVILVQLSGTSLISSTGIHFGIAGKYVDEKSSRTYIELYPDGTFYAKNNDGRAAEGTYKVVDNIVRMCTNFGCTELTISNNYLIDSGSARYKKV